MSSAAAPTGMHGSQMGYELGQAWLPQSLEHAKTRDKGGPDGTYGGLH